jgi:hypothetical protein
LPAGNALLSVQDHPEAARRSSPADTAREANPDLDAWNRPELLVQLLRQELDTGYKLVTFYTACVTAYAAMVGFAVKYYFECFATLREASVLVAQIGLFLGLFTLIAPWGLETSRREIATKANKYAEALGIPTERFTVVRYGMWLSVPLFGAIVCAWAVLLVRAAT